MNVPLARCLALAGALLLPACSDGTSPDNGDNGAAARFDALADSIARGGDPVRADALRHAAVVVRLTGAPTPVSLTIDGAARQFVAVAEELEYPNIVCSWPGDTGVVFPDPDGTPPDTIMHPPTPPMPPREPVCDTHGMHRMRALIAWEPERMEEVVRLVADEGQGEVRPGIPDPMAGPGHHGEGWGGGPGHPDAPPPVSPPPGTPPTPGPPPPPDSSVMPPPPVPTGPGFMGEYFERATGFWWSVSGRQSNALEQEGGQCTQGEVEFDWARYACQAIRVRVEFTMRVERLVPVPFDGWNPGDPLPTPPLESRDIAMEAASVGGARLSLLEWLPPPVEPPISPPLGPPIPEPQPGAR